MPGHARIEWRPVAAGGGWAVAPTATTVDGAAAGRRRRPRRSGRHLAGRPPAAARATGQYAGNLLGQPTLVERLAPPASFTAGAPEPLDAAPDPQVAVHAFGADATRFVRAVPVDGPVRLVVLVAPNGDTWQVVGVQAPR